ncbi:hypothetical protein A2U01_0089547, partial [Trifolium medium]|nr:hypothetical protein [Trifolium medium]
AAQACAGRSWSVLGCAGCSAILRYTQQI